MLTIRYTNQHLALTIFMFCVNQPVYIVAWLTCMLKQLYRLVQKYGVTTKTYWCLSNVARRGISPAVLVAAVGSRRLLVCHVDSQMMRWGILCSDDPVILVGQVYPQMS